MRCSCRLGALREQVWTFHHTRLQKKGIVLMQKWLILDSNARRLGACFASASIEEKEKNESQVVSFLCGCEKSVIRFYAKRITCKCLEEKYKSVKAEAKPKAGMCGCCHKCDDRKNLRMCTGCNSTYCELCLLRLY